MLAQLAGLVAGLWAATAILLARLVTDRRLDLLELGSLVVFGAIAILTTLHVVSASVLGVRLAADIGLCLTLALAAALHRPFNPQIPPASAQRIGTIWALAFAAIALADSAMLYANAGVALGVFVTAGALVGAALLTAARSPHVAQGGQHARRRERHVA